MEIAAAVPTVEVRIMLDANAFRELIDYPIIVEGWERRQNGRTRRRWEAEFTEAEQKVITQCQNAFRRWHLQAGPPAQVDLREYDVPLLQRAVHFFAIC